MDLDDVRKSICLSRNAFPDMVRVLYRRFHLKNYYRLCKFVVSYYRRQIYIESIRVVQLEWSDLEHDPFDQGRALSTYLGSFPLATEFAVGANGLVLVVPHRIVDWPGYAAPMSTHVRVCLTLTSSALSDIQPLRMKVHGSVIEQVYALEIGPACELDWDLSIWSRVLRESTQATTSFPIEPAGPDGLPFSAICNRPIISVTMAGTVDLSILSEHLLQRQQLGWDSIKVWTLYVTSMSSLPRFLLQNRYVTDLDITEGRLLPFGLGVFLNLDWTIMSRVADRPHSLRNLRIKLNLVKPHIDNLEFRLQASIDRLNESGPPFTLETLTLQLELASGDAKAMTTLPPSSLIAKLLVCLAGSHFRLHIELPALDEVDEVDAGRCGYLQSQLVQEVTLRQRKEWSRMKLAG